MRQEDLADLIQQTKKQLADFERNIRNAPQEKRGELKSWSQKNKTKLKELEKIFKSGTWHIEEE
jgi:hypothetical protein